METEREMKKLEAIVGREAGWKLDLAARACPANEYDYAFGLFIQVQR